MLDLHNGFCGSSQEPSITGSFLDLVLATQGLRCATVIKKQTRPGQVNLVRNTHFETNAKLEEFLLGHAAGTDVYHACATFQTSVNRKKENAAFYRSVWIDSDLKPFDVAFAATRQFLEASGMLFPSLVVASAGEAGGLHAYWVFTRDLALDEWEPVALGLRRLCELYKLAIDGKCTQDAVRILRPPGTLNHKPEYGSPQRVEHNVTGPAYDFDEFKAMLTKALATCGVALPAVPQRLVNGHDTPSAFIKSAPTPYDRDGFDRLCSALGSIDATFDHETWRNVMFSLKYLTGHGWPDDACYRILANWSATASKYRVEPHFSNNQNQWKAARPGGGITDATIFDMAIKKGWRA